LNYYLFQPKLDLYDILAKKKRQVTDSARCRLSYPDVSSRYEV